MKIQTKTILAVVLIAVVAGVVWYSGKKDGEEIKAGWNTVTNAEEGITFQYPSILSTTYIEAFDWPPGVQVLHGPFTCTEAGEENERAGKTESRVINGQEYCVTTIREGAAGSIYTQYAYALLVEDNVVFFTFSLRSLQCANFDEPEKNLCEEEQGTFTIDPIIDEIAGTIELEEVDEEQGVACTLEALICPDGSGVGRSGPNCEFSPCPNQDSFVGTLLQTPDGFRLVMEAPDLIPGAEYTLPLELRISNAIQDLVGKEVVVRGTFSEGSTLHVETLEAAP